MKKLGIVFVLVMFMASLALAGDAAQTIVVKWQRVIDKDGKTCDRCGATEVELKKAMELLDKEGIKAELKMADMTVEDFAKNCSESNRIWINDKPMEEILGAKVGTSKCSGVCTSHKEDAQCRTLILGEKTYESIPAEIIANAGLMACGKEAKLEPAKSLGCAKSCAKTCGKEAAAACGGTKK